MWAAICGVFAGVSCDCSHLATQSTCPFALVVEIQSYHQEVLPASARFAQSLGAPCVVVWHTGRKDFGMSELFAGWGDRGLAFLRGRNAGLDLLRRPHLAYVFVQTFELYEFNSPSQLSRILDGATAAAGAGREMPLIAGCHNVAPCVATLGNATARPGLRVMTVAFTEQAQTLLRGRLGSAHRPAVLLPAYFGTYPPRGAPPLGQAAAMRFVAFSRVDFTSKNWRALGQLGSWSHRSRRALAVTVFGAFKTDQDAAEFNALAATVSAQSGGQVRLGNAHGSWTKAVAIARRAMFVLPMVDERGDARYVRSGKLASSIAMAIALDLPLVVWSEAARVYGLGAQLEYASSSAMGEAMARGVEMLERNYSRYEGMRRELRRRRGAIFARARATACANRQFMNMVSERLGRSATSTCNGRIGS